MRLAFSLYELRSRHPLGKSAGPIREGALLRVQFEDGSVGYADCHPWPELGDETLGQQLDRLARGLSTPLSLRSLALAGIDARFRAKARSAFSQPIPESHIFLGNAPDLAEGDIEHWAREGFRLMKVKSGGNEEELRKLSLLCGLARERGLKLRIDFNEGLSEENAFPFLDSLCSGGTAEAIDFLEDPLPFDPESWSRLKARFPLRLALDRAVSGVALGALQGIADVVVIKPAVMDPQALIEDAPAGLRIIITTYLDHPLGSAGAAWFAAQARAKLGERVESCGLMTHLNYEQTPFSLRIGREGTRLIAPGRTGLGFDEELDRLRWKELVA